MSEPWLYPFRLEPTADAYLFAWGRVAAHRAASPARPDPFYSAMNRAAGENKPSHFLVTVGLKAAALYVEQTEGFDSAHAMLERDYAFPLKAFKLPQWELEPIQETFEQWKKALVPDESAVARESREFRDNLQSRLIRFPQDPRLVDYGVAVRIDEYYGELERAQAKHLRAFRQGLEEKNYGKARRGWNAYQKIVEYLRRPTEVRS